MARAGATEGAGDCLEGSPEPEAEPGADILVGWAACRGPKGENAQPKSIRAWENRVNQPKSTGSFFALYLALPTASFESNSGPR